MPPDAAILPAKGGDTPPEDQADQRLTLKEERFVHEFLLDYNQTAAARRSGYRGKRPDKAGSDLMSRPHLRAAIKRRQAELVNDIMVNQHRVIERLAAHAFSDLSQAIEYYEEDVVVDGKVVHAKGDIRRIEITKVEGRIIKGFRITETKDGEQRINIDAYDAQDAAHKLGKHLGMWGEEASAPPTVNFIFKTDPGQRVRTAYKDGAAAVQIDPAGELDDE